MSTQNAITQTQAIEHATAPLAQRLDIPTAVMARTLDDVVFAAAKMNAQEKVSFLLTCNEHRLNPITKEIYPFKAQSGAIVPVVAIDGWLRIMNEHPQFDGIEYKYAEEDLDMDGKHKPCPAYIDAIITRKDRSKPIVVREYLDECYQEPRGQNSFAGPWQNFTKRMLRWKATIQCARVAFGFSGISDDLSPLNEVATGPASGVVYEAEPLTEPQPMEETQAAPKAQALVGESEKKTLLQLALAKGHHADWFVETVGYDINDIPLNMFAEVMETLKAS